MPRLNRRMVGVVIALMAVTAVEIVIVRTMLMHRGLLVDFWLRLLLAVLALAPDLGVGLLIWMVFRAFRRDLRSYLRALMTKEWLLTSFLVVTLTAMTTYFYSVLKNSIPIFTARNYDQLLWNLDRALFFGLSPNVFFLNVFSSEWLVRLIDFGYGNVFFVALTVGCPLFFAQTKNGVRIAFFVGNAFVWNLGAWLYFVVPSLGPCYKFYGVWEEVKEWFPVSTFLQFHLLENYQKVLRVREGVIDPTIDLIEGIGAFPSLHVAFHVFLALWIGRLSRFWGRVAWAVVVFMFIGSIVTGWHYMIDSVAGVALGIAGYGVSLAILRWTGGEDGDDDEGSVELEGGAADSQVC